MRRSNMLVLVGVAFFVLGVIIVALIANNSDSSSSSTTSGTSQTVDVLEAKEDIPAGTKGDDATTKVAVVRVNASDKQPDALTTPSELSNQIFSPPVRICSPLVNLAVKI